VLQVLKSFVAPTKPSIFPGTPYGPVIDGSTAIVRNISPKSQRTIPVLLLHTPVASRKFCFSNLRRICIAHLHKLVPGTKETDCLRELHGSLLLERVRKYSSKTLRTRTPKTK
jgi:hypothetical protein